MKNATRKVCEIDEAFTLPLINPPDVFFEWIPCGRPAIGFWQGVWLCPRCMNKLNPEWTGIE